MAVDVPWTFVDVVVFVLVGGGNNVHAVCGRSWTFHFRGGRTPLVLTVIVHGFCGHYSMVLDAFRSCRGVVVDDPSFRCEPPTGTLRGAVVHDQRPVFEHCYAFVEEGPFADPPVFAGVGP